MLNIRPQNMDLSNLTIIIPSYNRPQHVIQTLKFWSKFNVNLHLVDGSKKPVLDFQNIIINTKIKYHHIQILSEVDRIKKILPLIKTKYSNSNVELNVAKCNKCCPCENNKVRCSNQGVCVLRAVKTTVSLFSLPSVVMVVLPKDANLSQNSTDLLVKMITDAEVRLGRNGADEVKAHPFFHGFDWNNLRQRKAPYQPKV